MSCTVLLARKWEQPTAPGGARLYQVDLDWALGRQWESKTWEQGDIIRAGAYDAECISGGRAGAVPPRFPVTLGKEFTDGSVRWKIVAPSSSSLETTINTFDWAAPTGIVASGGQDTATGSVRMLTVGSSVEPGEYELMVTATCQNGEIIKQPCILLVA